jgi:hypothetical protein
MANRFRKLFGFEQIENHPAAEHHHHPHHAKLVPIESVATMPFPPIPGDGEMHILPFMEHVENTSAPPAHRHSHHRHHRLQNAPFMERLSHSLMMLGRWEGRAIAFVLGCGIGVVLRMIYVLILVTYRMFRGPAQPGEDEADEEETEVLLVAAPPEYGKDEKVAL